MTESEQDESVIDLPIAIAGDLYGIAEVSESKEMSHQQSLLSKPSMSAKNKNAENGAFNFEENTTIKIEQTETNRPIDES